jgi:prepilin peptidase CpaA
MSDLSLAVKLALALVVTGAAIHDCKYRKIPNWFNLSALVLGIGLNALMSGVPGLISSCEGLLLALAVYMPLYVVNGMGAGDVKLMAAVGSLVGPVRWLEILLATSVLGGLVAFIFAWRKKRLTETCWNVLGILEDLVHFRLPYRSNPQLDIRNAHSLRMPHGITIAIGSATFLVLTFASASPALP